MLDIKPYVPADCLDVKRARFAPWVPIVTPEMSERDDAGGSALDVNISESAKGDLRECVGAACVFKNLRRSDGCDNPGAAFRYSIVQAKGRRRRDAGARVQAWRPAA